VIGEKARHEALLARMSAAGHELANHLHADEPARRAGRRVRRQLARVDTLIEAPRTEVVPAGLGLVPRPHAAPARRQGYRLSLAPSTAGRLVPSARFARATSSGGSSRRLIVLHEGRSDRMRTLRVLERILPAIKARDSRS